MTPALLNLSALFHCPRFIFCCPRHRVELWLWCGGSAVRRRSRFQLRGGQSAFQKPFIQWFDSNELAEVQKKKPKP